MSNVVQTVALAVLLLCALPRLGLAQARPPLNLVPWPKSVEAGAGAMRLTASSRIVVGDEALLPLANVLAGEIELRAGTRLPVAQGDAKPGDVALALRPGLNGEAYELTVADGVVVSGGSYVAVAHGTATLLQLLAPGDGGAVDVPRLTIKDEPSTEFRSVMLDLARRWHPVDTIKDTIELLRLYKVRYLHLHLSDNESFTFTSKAFPSLATPNRSYTAEQMGDLVRYADERGVTIIPEIEMPGHCGPMVGRLPEWLGTTDPATGKAVSTGIVNMANEKAYDALDVLLGEVAETFKSSPYIHIGADETGADGLQKLPEYLPYVRKHGLAEAQAGRPGELFAHFIVRMNEIVKGKGRKMIVWNGFPYRGTANVKVPAKEILVMAWTGSPLDLLAKGYEIVNCGWMPLYMVPPQGRAPLAEWIYDWNLHQAGSWEGPKPVEIPAEAPVRGAQICFWEQRYNEVMPILRPRVPALSERLWNPAAGKSFADFRARADQADLVVERIVRPVRLKSEGTIEGGGDAFENEARVTLRTESKGTIRYTLSKPWEEFPTASSPAYAKPIVLKETTTVSAQLFDPSGRPVGGVTQHRFAKTISAYRYRVMGPSPRPSWSELPDFNALAVQQSGVMGLMTRDRGEQINRGMFAGLQPEAHVDVRPPGLWNPRALELTGRVRIPTDGVYAIKLKAADGQAELEIGGRVVRKTRAGGADNVVEGTLKAGTYPMTIRYFNRQIRNDLNIQVKTPGSDKFVPFETLVVPMGKWTKAELDTLGEGTTFVDPAKASMMNLATDKPVTVSGGTQGMNVPGNAVDGITSNDSGWHASPSPQWLIVDLQGAYATDRVKVYTYYGDGRHYQYTVETSPDGKTWESAVDMSNNTQPSTDSGDEHHFAARTARFVRVTLLKNSANEGLHLNELMVFEAK